jgi:hypothetical protein
MSRLFYFAVVALVASQCIALDIPLSDVTSTLRYEGMKYIGSGRRSDGTKTVVEDYADAMSRLLASTGGASNVILVDANSINDAVKATARVLAGVRSADKPAISWNTVSGKHWLLVYLGCGHSNPHKWVVESILIKGNVIRFRYRKPRSSFETADIQHYYYWVPIGKLENGVYTLELYDSGLKSVTLMRRVEIGKEL